MRFQKIGTLLLLLLLLSGCGGMGGAPPAEADEEELSVAALFQTENGDTILSLPARKFFRRRLLLDENSLVEASSLLFNEAKISAKAVYTIFAKLFYFLYTSFRNQLKSH